MLTWTPVSVPQLSHFLFSHNALNGDTSWPVWKWFLNIPLGWVAWVSGCPFLGYGREVSAFRVDLGPGLEGRGGRREGAAGQDGC